LKIIIIGGFLGSGKTTAIQYLAKYFAKLGKTVAVLVNEAGEVDIGGDLFGYDVDTEEVTRACVTCDLKAVLTFSVAQMVEKVHPDIFFIEPKETVSPLVVREELAISTIRRGGNEYDFAPLITLVDCSCFFKNVKEKKRITFDQILVSEVVVLNKIDLVDANTVEMIRESVMQINPKATVLMNTNQNEQGMKDILKLVE
jgi:G3E family GTPase